MPRRGMTLKEKAERRKRITDEFWAQKQAGAHTPQERCQLAWDRIRAEISNLPAHQRDQWWAQIAGQLEQVPQQLPKR